MASQSLKLNPLKSTAQPIITHEEISRRAYALWMERGRPFGTDEENWFRAENELKTNPSTQAG